MAQPAKHYTVRRLAEERWGCSLSHVYDLIDSDQLKALRIGKAIRIPPLYVEEYEAGHRIWEEKLERKPCSDSENTEDTGTSAGQKVESLSVYQQAKLSAMQPKSTSRIT